MFSKQMHFIGKKNPCICLKNVKAYSEPIVHCYISEVKYRNHPNWNVPSIFVL